MVIDLHSANQFNPRDGFINSAMLYMEHFPFISRLWFGEYFDYDQDADYWMTEVSGLPFGLMGEMLQDGGHPYRGMLYGMTARKYGDVDPRPVWAHDERLRHRREPDDGLLAGERSGHDRPPAGSWPPPTSAPTELLIALASWSEEDEVVNLTVDWEALGLGETGGAAGGASSTQAPRAYAPSVEGLQDEAEVDLTSVRVPAGQGLFVVVRADPGEGG